MTGHERVLTITHPAGLLRRSAALLVRTASRFQAQITLKNLSRDGTPEADAKSMLGVMQAAVSQGHQVRVQADGADAAEAVAALAGLVESNFAEA